MKWINRLFCNHQYSFVRNIYGDEINIISVHVVYRSWWKCTKCGKLIVKPCLFNRINKIHC